MGQGRGVECRHHAGPCRGRGAVGSHHRGMPDRQSATESVNVEVAKAGQSGGKLARAEAVKATTERLNRTLAILEN